MSSTETADALLAARWEEQPRLLKLFDDEDLLGELRGVGNVSPGAGHRLSNWSEGKYEYDPEVEAFHPDCGQV